MKKFTKRYQLWVRSDCGYTFTEFETIEECLLADKYYTSDWYITEKVDFKVDKTTN